MKYTLEANESNNIYNNISDEYKQKIASSELILDYSIKINIFATIFAIIIGSFGNLLTILVYSRKKFRINSSNVYLFCLALNNCLFLVVHFFEDILRTYKNVFLKNSSSTTRSFYDFINLINITDRFDSTCKLINYFRYVLRFISAYIIVAFTIQRVILVFSPLFHKLRYKRSAWISVFFIAFLSCLLNMWVPFLFEVQSENEIDYCDMKKVWKKEYFSITIFYICVIILVPSLIILVCNFIIICGTYRIKRSFYKTKKNLSLNAKSIHFKRMLNANKLTSHLQHQTECRMSLKRNRLNSKSKKIHLTSNKLVSKISGKTNSAKKWTKMLLFISFSYILLNLPYLISWMLFYYHIAFKNIDLVLKNYLFASLQISEIFYVLNYGLLFYLYSASGSIFKNRLAKPNSYMNLKLQ